MLLEICLTLIGTNDITKKQDIRAIIYQKFGWESVIPFVDVAMR